MAGRRDKTIDIPDWWLEQANARIRASSMKLDDIVKAIASLDPPVREATIDKHAISRLLSGVRGTHNLADGLRRVLHMPRFVFFASDEREAWKLAETQADYQRDRDPREELSDLEKEAGIEPGKTRHLRRRSEKTV